MELAFATRDQGLACTRQSAVENAEPLVIWVAMEIRGTLLDDSPQMSVRRPAPRDEAQRLYGG